jgi:hypothetical protein
MLKFFLKQINGLIAMEQIAKTVKNTLGLFRNERTWGGGLEGRSK